ncbi:radical SAM protein [bacterium]|nr:radical SAM protein [bacterium]
MFVEEGGGLLNGRDFLTRIYPKSLAAKAAYRGWLPVPRPITLTFSVTNVCQSRCKTCQIWRIYPEKHQDVRNELKIDEIGRIFRSIGPVYFFNLSGGEPFLRKDLPEICEAAVESLRPAIIHSPTNALWPDRIVSHTRSILEMLKRRGLHTAVTIKPSIDGVGPLHDEIRGVEGNWEKLLETVRRLQELEKEHPNLHIELGTVVSNFNKDHLEEIEDFVHGLGVQSYRNEIAEQREEFLNVGDPITPTGEEYAALMKNFAEKVRANLKTKRPLARVTESLRLVYYDLAARIVTEGRQVAPCYAGITNVHLTPHGDLWPCCVLGYAKPMGNLREADYDFWKVWRSKQAAEVRRSIRNRECACPLANQAYSNIICHTPSLLKAIRNIVSASG